jgi:hypothetical protein
MNAIYVFCAFVVFFIWVWTADSINTSFNGDTQSKLSDLINGTAHRPYVQRVFIPIATRTIYQTFPAHWHESISHLFAHQSKIQKEMQRLGWEEGYVPQYLIALTLSFLFLLIFPFTMRSIIRIIYDTEEWIINIIPILILLGLPQFYHAGTRYIYDFPALTLFTLGFCFMLQKKWYYYYGIFIIGLINKETMVLLSVPLAIIYYGKISSKYYWGHLIAHGSLFIAIRGLISWYFRNNPGYNFEFHIFGNIRMLADLCTPQQVIIWGVVFVLLAYHFNQKPIILRKALLTSLPFIILTLLFGYIHELRALYEIYPIFAILILHTIFFSIFQFRYNEQNVLGGLSEISEQ